VDIVIATPGRLIDLIRHANFSGLTFLVLDEADRMLDMGFLPSIRQIVKAIPQKRQTLLFSATLSKEIESLTSEFLRNPKTVQIGRRSNPAETVTQLIYEVPKHLKPNLLVHLLHDKQLDSVLVFTRTKHGADRVAKKLEGHKIKTATLHSNRSQNQRLRALKEFKSGEVRVLVATDIAARGIDVTGISHVVNFDFPMHPEDYVHRIGRTGRRTLLVTRSALSHRKITARLRHWSGSSGAASCGSAQKVSITTHQPRPHRRSRAGNGALHPLGLGHRCAEKARRRADAVVGVAAGVLGAGVGHEAGASIAKLRLGDRHLSTAGGFRLNKRADALRDGRRGT
jgi:superfamily II DNA/RNA helicase